MAKSLSLRSVCAILSLVAAVLSAAVWWTSSHQPDHVARPVTPVASKTLRQSTPPTTPPAVDPVKYLPLTPAEAVAFNATKVSDGDVGPPASSFRLTSTAGDISRAVRCLAEAVYYEAASQDVAGQRAVAQVVINRVRSPAFPATVCGVVYQGSERATGCQFTFTCDGALRRRPAAPAWTRAEKIARAALAGSVFEPVGYATHYHADWVVPYWAASLTRATAIGAHIFYRWKGPWGRPQAFSQAYAAAEPEPPLNKLLQPNLAELQLDDVLSDQRTDSTRTVLAEDRLTDGHRLVADDAARKSKLLVDEKPPVLISSSANRPGKLIAPRRSASNGLREPTPSTEPRAPVNLALQ